MEHHSLPPPPATSSAVDLAEKAEYAALVRAVQLRPELAQEVDDFGMTPLHWACSDSRVPLRALQQLVLAHPRATAAVNLAGLLPLHIALRKNLPLDALKLLLKFHTKAIVVPTPDGRTPLELAAEHVTAPSARAFLEMLDAEVRALGRAASASKRQHKQQQLRDACEAPPSKPRSSSRAHLQHPPSLASLRESTGDANNNNNNSHHYHHQEQQQQLKEDGLAIETQASAVAPAATAYRDPIAECLSSPSMRAAAVPQSAPAWKLAKRCHICDCKFGYFKSRHHCRNCGESVCSRHSRHSLPLRHFGLFHPQRVCAVCHEHLQNTLAGCNTNESGRGYSRSRAFSRSRADSTASSCFSFASEALEADCSSNSSRSMVWNFEAPSPRVFNTAPLPPKRSRSVRSFLLPSPRRRASKGDNYALDSTSSCGSLASPVAASPAARDVRSELAQRNNSYATLSRMPMLPSASSMFLSRVQMAPAPSHLVQAHQKETEQQQARRHSKGQKDGGKQENDDVTDADKPMNAHGSARTKRRLVKTELDAPSKTWYEELEQLPQTPGEKLSMDSRVAELEQQVQKLLAAKKQIGVALKKSQLQVHLARVEKDAYDAIAQKYVDDGYAPCSPPRSVRGDLELVEALGCADLLEERSGRQQEPMGSSCTASTSASSRETPSEGRRESENSNDNLRSTLSDESASQSARPSSPLPAPRLSPFRSEKLDLHIPLDVAATHHELGVVLLGKCDFSSAADEFHKALGINASDAVAWYHLAKALDGAGELAAAEHAVNKALVLDPTSLPSLSLLGRLLHLRGEHDEAIVVFRKALNLQCSPSSLVDNQLDTCGTETR